MLSAINREYVRASNPVFREVQESDRLLYAVNTNLGIFMRNGVGGDYDVSRMIRSMAYRKEGQGSLDVLEVCNTIPLKALEFHNPERFRWRGDHMSRSLDSVPHKLPKTTVCVVSDRDYTREILELPSNIDDYVLRNTRNGITSGCFWKEGMDPNTIGPCRDYYAEQKTDKGNIRIELSEDPVIGLQKLYEAGRRFDLAFPLLAESSNRFKYIEQIQHLLKPGGVAYVPLTWWKKLTDETFKVGSTNAIHFGDTVRFNGREMSLCDYLVNLFPDAFDIAHFPDSPTLIIKGTENGVSLPLDPESRIVPGLMYESGYPEMIWNLEADDKSRGTNDSIFTDLALSNRGNTIVD